MKGSRRVNAGRIGLRALLSSPPGLLGHMQFEPCKHRISAESTPLLEALSLLETKGPSKLGCQRGQSAYTGFHHGIEAGIWPVQLLEPFQVDLYGPNSLFCIMVQGIGTLSPFASDPPTSTALPTQSQPGLFSCRPKWPEASRAMAAAAAGPAERK